MIEVRTFCLHCKLAQSGQQKDIFLIGNYFKPMCNDFFEDLSWLKKFYYRLTHGLDTGFIRA